MSNVVNAISIVIGSWGSYNECNERACGSKWFDLSDYDDWDDIETELKQQGFELDGMDEELFIQDIENLPSSAANWDYMNPEDLFNTLKEADVLDDTYNNNHSRIIWMGDYADQFASELEDKHNGLTKAKIKSYHKRCWGEDDNTIAIPTTEFTLDDKYLINHTKREYINCSTYYKESEMEDEWCLHPLPLLTCIGNGLGGGDYRRPTLGSSTELVGMWAWDEISITDEPISDYTEIFPIFKEDWR